MKPKKPAIGDWADLSISQLMQKLGTSREGLEQVEAKRRLKEEGGNVVANGKTSHSGWRIMVAQFENWLIVALLISAAISFFLGEHVDAVIVILLVVISVGLGFLQEYKAENSLEKLKKYITHKVRVKRDGEWQEIDSKNLVAGDVVKIQIGDIVPADIRLVKADDLTVNEAVLTGESVPMVKTVKMLKAGAKQPQDCTNMAFMGSTVESGYGEGVVVMTGSASLLGQTAKVLGQKSPETEFQKQTRKFSGFLFRIILIMALFVFAANAILGKELFDSFLFALALAVGITPELLPAITTMTLAQGALKMAKRKVVVKKLMSVEDLGNIDVLCTDKTGTLTKGVFSLVDYVDTKGKRDKEVLLKALVCTGGFIHGKGFDTANPTDRALLASKAIKGLDKEAQAYQVVDENEFDFIRRRMSILVAKDGENLLVVKGAPEAIVVACRLKKEQRENVLKKVGEYENQGQRIIGVAQKATKKNVTSKQDEKGLRLLGFLLFSDPVKTGVKEAFGLYRQLGVEIKVLSGDSVAVTGNVARQAGIEVAAEEIITGEMLTGLTNRQIESYAKRYCLFARVTPEQKHKIVASLNKKGHVVGFLGDGVNDAPALKAADVGIAVDSGAPLAKEAADIILLRKDLRILAEGIRDGRKNFGNIMKYILNTVSANLGNMVTVAASSLFLKFIPLLPKQILLNNLISDVPLFTIAGDNVDEELTKKPKRWNIKMIGRFMLYFGLISSVFDLIFILPMAFIWKLPADLFRTAWFIESSISEMMVTFTIRTRLPFFKSRPSGLLLISSLISSSAVIVLPVLGLGAEAFGFRDIPLDLWLWTGFVVASYFAVAEVAKYHFFEKNDNKD